MPRSKISLTSEQKSRHEAIRALQNIISSGTLTSSELAQQLDMTKKQKEKLVSQIYFKNKKTKDFYLCKDGRIKSYNPQFIADSREQLIDKLYDYYFNNTLEDVYGQWLRHRMETKIVTSKTIEEYMGLWRRFLADSEIAHMQIADIRAKHLMKLFQKWTGNGLITRKDFNNRKSLLNGIFRHAALNELISFNPITSIPCNELKFKLPNARRKAYTIEEREKLLAYLDTLEFDAYVGAITLDFYGIFRIGEIKGLSWDESDGNRVTIKRQLIEERALQEDLTLGHPYRVLKDPKGNPYYSIRTEVVSEKGLEILRKMKALNPSGETLFMHQGRPLTTDTFNRRLKGYCAAAGVPYLSSHKIRFTGASMLYDAGMKAIDIQPLLGHSTLTMTEHYIGQRVKEQDTSQMSQILA